MVITTAAFMHARARIMHVVHNAVSGRGQVGVGAGMGVFVGGGRPVVFTTRSGDKFGKREGHI